MAAVNDITAREEQFQSFLTQNKTDNHPKEDSILVSYYSNSDTKSIESPLRSAPAKNESASLNQSAVQSMKSELLSNDASTKEFVDYSEVKFIENKTESQRSDEENTVGAKRKLRRKTTKKRDEDCMGKMRFSFISRY